MRIFTLYKNRLAIRNLIFATLISVVYLVGKHFQAAHHITGDSVAKIVNTLRK